MTEPSSPHPTDALRAEMIKAVQEESCPWVLSLNMIRTWYDREVAPTLGVEEMALRKQLAKEQAMLNAARTLLLQGPLKGESRDDWHRKLARALGMASD